MKVLFSSSILIVFLLFSNGILAQGFDLPKNPKPGNCYIRCYDDDRLSDWKIIDCKFKEMIKDSVKRKTWQIKLHNLGYDVDVNGKLDSKTIDAYNQYLKDERKRKKEKRKRARKEKKANKS